MLQMKSEQAVTGQKQQEQQQEYEAALLEANHRVALAEEAERETADDYGSCDLVCCQPFGHAVGMCSRHTCTVCCTCSSLLLVITGCAVCTCCKWSNTMA